MERSEQDDRGREPAPEPECEQAAGPASESPTESVGAPGPATASPAEGVRVRGAPTRCPYCHEACDADAAVVACRACVAKHHADCWAALGRCAACGGERGLGEAVAAPPAAPPELVVSYRADVQRASQVEPPGVRRAVGLVFALGAAICAALTLFTFLAASIAVVRGVLGAPGAGDVVAVAALVAFPLVFLTWACYHSARIRLGRDAPAGASSAAKAPAKPSADKEPRPI